jgi:hypothetical protein
MSQIGRWIGVAFLGGGIALGAGARRAQENARAAREARASAAKASAAETTQRLEAEARAAEAAGARAAALQPLNAAIESHVDGTTLVDLFEHEDWWQPFREEFAGARVIVGDALLAAWGKVDFGTADAPVVRAARERQIASARASLGGQDYLVVAARLRAMPQREPVLVLARRASPPPRPRPRGATRSTGRCRSQPPRRSRQSVSASSSAAEPNDAPPRVTPSSAPRSRASRRCGSARPRAPCPHPSRRATLASRARDRRCRRAGA